MRKFHQFETDKFRNIQKLNTKKAQCFKILSKIRDLNVFRANKQKV